MTLALIAAVARNGIIGAGNAMPWRLKSDMARFRRLTMGKPVVMGMRTFESIGGPLAGRTNIVVTRQKGFAAAGVVVAASVDRALEIAGEQARGGEGEIMVIGGGELYGQAIGRADRLYITHVDAAPDGDTRFPAIDPAVWSVVSREKVPAGEKDSAATEFIVYRRFGS